MEGSTRTISHDVSIGYVSNLIDTMDTTSLLSVGAIEDDGIELGSGMIDTPCSVGIGEGDCVTIGGIGRIVGCCSSEQTNDGGGLGANVHTNLRMNP